MNYQLVMIGPPGAGKGTQAERLAAYFGIPHIATGDMIRAEIARRSPLGLKAEQVIAGGDFIPDADMIAMVQDRLAQPDASRGFILDGFPRDLAQAQKFSSVDQGGQLTAVIVLELPEPDIVDRLSRRLVCPTCGRSYLLRLNPPKNDTVCDLDGTPLVRRPDDAPDAVHHRIQVYKEVTAPLIAYYAACGLTRTVDASPRPDQVFAAILTALGVTGAQSQ